MAEQNENRMQDIIRTSLEHIRAMVDANTVVGTPIETASGTTIIPISKVSVGYASGGADSANRADVSTKTLFAGGGGTGLTVQPVCFIAVNAQGAVDVLPMNGTVTQPDLLDTIAGFVEKTPEFISRIKALFPEKKSKKSKDEMVDDLARDAADAVSDVLDDEEL